MWLYAWLVLGQTRQDGTIGWALGDPPSTYREIDTSV